MRRKSEVLRAIAAESLKPVKGPPMQIPAFARDLIERAIKTTAQTALLFFGANQVNVLDVDWETVLGLSGGAALLSVLTSLASLKLGNSGTASLTKAVEPAA